MKKLTLTMATVSAMLTPLTSHAENIGVAMSAFDDNFLTILRMAIQDQAKKSKAVELQFEDATNDIGKQLSQVQNFIAKKVDAIIVNPVDTDATPKITKMATQAGIPLVYVNRMPSEKQLPAKVAFVGSNELEAGTLQAKEVCRMLNGKGTIAIMMGDLAYQAARQRTQAVRDVMAKAPCNGIKIADERVANWMRTPAYDLMSSWISAGLKFNAVLANNDEMALGAIQGLKATGKQKEVIVAGIDATRDALASMKGGDLKVSVFQNAAMQGAGSLDTALKLARGQQSDSMVWIPFELVTPANMDQYTKKN